jgi:adenylosuccinate synthase
MVVTKLDVMSNMEKVRICVAYDVDGVRYDDIPMTQTAFHHAVPVFEEMDGWWEDITKCRDFSELPVNAQRYVERIEELCGARVSVVGVGPGREENVTRHPLLAA